MVTKNEQIAEALRATQMMLNKHSDKWVDLLSPTRWMLSAVHRLQSEAHSLCFLFQNDRRGKRKCPGAAEGAQPGLQWTLQALFRSDDLCGRGLKPVCVCVLWCVREQCHLMFSCMTNLFPPSTVWAVVFCITLFILILIIRHREHDFLNVKPRRSKYAVNMLRCAQLWSDMSPLLIWRLTLYLQYVMWLTTLFLQDAGYCIPRCMKALNVFSVTLPMQSCTCAHDVLTCP